MLRREIRCLRGARTKRQIEYERASGAASPRRSKEGPGVRMRVGLLRGWRTGWVQTIDSTHTEAHRSAAGEKRGALASYWRLVRRA